jgi:hypothetical protein
MSTDPLAPLHVKSPTNASLGIRVETTGTGTGSYSGFDFYNTSGLIGQFFSTGASYSAGQVIGANSLGLFSSSANAGLAIGTLNTSSPVTITAGGIGATATVAQFRYSGSYRGMFLREQGGAPTHIADLFALYPLASDGTLRGKDDAGTEFLLSMWREHVATDYWSNSYKNSLSIFSKKTGDILGITQNAVIEGVSVIAQVTGAYHSAIRFTSGRYSILTSPDSQTAGLPVTGAAERFAVERTGEVVLSSIASSSMTPSGASALYSLGETTDANLIAKGGSVCAPSKLTGFYTPLTFQDSDGDETITPNHQDTVVLVTGSNNTRVITLPAIKTCRTITIQNIGADSFTIDGGDSSIYNGSSQVVDSIKLIPGEVAKFIYSETSLFGVAWIREGNHYASGSFTVTLNGCTTSPTATWYWQKNGNVVTITTSTLMGTSDSENLSVNGIPTYIDPGTDTRFIACCIRDGGIDVETPQVGYNVDSNIVFTLDGNVNGFTATGQKGISNKFSFSYTI